MGQGHHKGPSLTRDASPHSTYKLLAIMLLTQPNGQLLVPIDHNQLRTMASETVDPMEAVIPTLIDSTP